MNILEKIEAITRFMEMEGVNYQKMDKEILWDYLDRLYPLIAADQEYEETELTDEEMNWIIAYFGGENEDVLLCAICEEPLDHEGNCPIGCTENEDYGVAEGLYYE